MALLGNRERLSARRALRDRARLRGRAAREAERGGRLGRPRDRLPAPARDPGDAARDLDRPRAQPLAGIVPGVRLRLARHEFRFDPRGTEALRVEGAAAVEAALKAATPLSASSRHRSDRPARGAGRPPPRRPRRGRRQGRAAGRRRGSAATAVRGRRRRERPLARVPVPPREQARRGDRSRERRGPRSARRALRTRRHPDREPRSALGARQLGLAARGGERAAIPISCTW